MRGRLVIVLLCVLAATYAGAQDADPAPAGSDLTVPEIAFGTGYDYETRSLVGEATAFTAPVERVWCRTRIVGAQEPTTVTHVWYRDGKTMARVELGVSSPSYRTVSSKKLLPDWTGVWEVKILDAEGTVLSAATFTVE